jgi:hypothetical protein
MLVLLADQEGELHVAPLPAVLLFSLLAGGSGPLVAAVAERLERFLPAPERWVRRYRGLAFLAALVCLVVLPALVWRVVLAIQHATTALMST